MKNKNILERFVNFLDGIENETKIKNVLTPEDKLKFIEYVQNNIEIATDDSIQKVYDILFTEIGELTPDPNQENIENKEEINKEEINKEKIIENAHIEAEKIVENENKEIKEIKNQILNFGQTIEILKNENKELKNKIEEFGNAPSGIVAKVPVVNQRELSDLEKQIEELHKKRNK